MPSSPDGALGPTESHRRSTSLLATALVVIALTGSLGLAAAVPAAGAAPADGGPAAVDPGDTVPQADAGTDLRTISYGETREGELDEDDPREQRQRGYHEPVTFDGERGDIVSVEMTATDGAPMVALFRSTDDGQPLAYGTGEGSSGTAAIENATLPADGEYTIIATSRDPEATFEYELGLEKTGDRADVDPDLRTIEYGETAASVLNETDPRANEYRGYHEPVTFEGSQGDVITVDMTSQGDTYLMLEGPNGTAVAENDDGGEGLNARLTHVVLPTDGEYTIYATSFSREATFFYELSLEQVGSGANVSRDVRSIDYGETVASRIDREDPQSRDYRGHYEPVTFDGSAGDVVTVDMVSSGDTYLFLQGPDGSAIASDDDGGDGLNSRLAVPLPADGEYTIVATSYSPDETFFYELSLDRTGQRENVSRDVRSIAYGESVSSYLGPSDPSAQEYRGNHEPITFEGESGDLVSVEMTSSGDTYLMLEGPEGSLVAENDDGGDGLNSELAVPLPAEGEYTIYATSFNPDESFFYDLSLTRTGSVENATMDLRSIEYGESAQSRLDPTDPRHEVYRGYYEPVTFEGSAGDEVSVGMTSEGDTYLLMVAPNGTIVADNDDGGSNLNAHIEGVELPADGEYTIVATSYDPSETFGYQLTLETEGATAASGGSDGDAGQTPGGLGPGFGVIGGLLALLAVAALAASRRH
jgi:O6-methylguanine-DNA--protein-cysteine methyltransferase